MIPFKIEIDDRALNARLAQFPAALRQRLIDTISRLTAKMHDVVLASEPYRTGKLRAATRSFIDQNENLVRGRVRILGENGQRHNIKAAALEYGAHAEVNVSAYTMLRGHFERPIAAYQRRINIEGRFFLRDALATIAPEARAEIEKAVSDATHGVVA